MDLVDSSCWVEVRPLVTSELKPANFAPVLDVLYNFGLPFRFVIADTKNKGRDGRCLVRFFIQLQNQQMQAQISNIIKTVLDAEITKTNQPIDNLQGSSAVDLELAKNYALPITNCLDKEPQNFVDRIVASIAGSNSCIEITAKADPSAALNIQKFVYEKTSNNNPNINKTIIDQGINIIGETVGQNPKNPTSKTRQTQTIDPWIKEHTKNAQAKLANKLFTCKITIKSTNLQQALTIKNALPATNMNHLKVAKCIKHKPTNTTNQKTNNTTKLKSPSRYFWRNNRP